MFFFFSTFMVLFTIAVLLFPVVWRPKTLLGRKSGSLTIFRDQLNEVAADLERGVLSTAEAESATIEIQRRMLALEKPANESDANPSVMQLYSRQGLWLPIAGAFLAPLFALSLYSLVGSPDTPSQGHSTRVAETQEAARIAELAARLRQNLDADPQSPTEGWILLGQTFMRANRYGDAVYAFGKATNRSDASASAFSQFAEALVAAENGIVTPNALAAADQALELDADNVAATYYKALGLEQSGARRRAFDLLKERLERENSFAQWMPTVLAQVNRIAAEIGEPPIQFGSVATMDAPRPTASDIEAATELSAEDRKAFILSMVERLANRLEETPDDLDGWLRLARAYTVVGDKAKALDAYKSAEKLLAPLPADDKRRRIVKDGMSRLRS